MPRHFWNLIFLIGLLLGASAPAYASAGVAPTPLPHFGILSPAPDREQRVPELGAHPFHRPVLGAVRTSSYRFLAGSLPSRSLVALIPPAGSVRLRHPRARASVPTLRGLPSSLRDPPD